MVVLPEDFCTRMKSMLGQEYPDFLACFKEPHVQGLRLNMRKVQPQTFLKQVPYSLEPIPWVENGYYYDASQHPGKHPYHEAGLYYIQEPSAMAVVELLQPQPGERVLDLCAAPGGKSTQIADKLAGIGFLLCNEYHPVRARILSQNVERLGIRNAVVTNESPSRLKQHFGAYFDKVLVDAPCSGEGMFRKNPLALQEWSPQNVQLCAKRQQEILHEAAEMVRAGGRLVYSTCTFSPEENEQTIEQFCRQHPEFRVEPVHACSCFAPGIPKWANGESCVKHTFRLWPHRLNGEGHYIAVLRKQEECKQEKKLPYYPNQVPDDIWKFYQTFARQFLTEIPMGKFVLFGKEIYIVPDEMADMEGLKVLRPGWHLGTVKKNRFEPSHALALALSPKKTVLQVDFSANSREIAAYLNGETILSRGENGWCLITVDGYSIGFGKRSGGVIKNHYPKGLRWKERRKGK